MVQERSLPAFQVEHGTISKEEGLRLYEDMSLGRLFEDKCAEMYYRGKMFGFVHLYNGQEAVSTGVIKAMRQDEDYVCSTYRDHVHALSAGVPAKEVMAELFGKETGCSKGRGGSMHLFDLERRFLGGYGVVGGSLPLSAGVALAADYAESDDVVLSMMGDGATNQGTFGETMNLAALWKLPVVFLVINNQFGMGTALHRH